MVWWKLISNGATIVDLARQVYTTLNKDKAASAPNSTDVHDVMNRINYLEKNEIRQAELIKRMAEQINALTSKIRTATILAIISSIIAAISIGWQLLNKY
ncbi:MAG TPA: hypothetical protein VD908_09210 [Cytophagales bacterium]|nr:hypothetical protein [Cytophagales bacterium]